MLPITVKVGGIDYSVVEVETVIIDGSTEYLGSCKLDESKLEILSDLSKTKKEQVFIHELLHACYHEAGFNEQEEDTINRLGKVLYQVIKDNEFNFTTADTAER